ncbi:MAG: flagellar basal-body rod protein FlgF [Proteobacteria bacterium]|nr:flagellar basal-body rod protein FlgF [Pseudomonadota bacterium]MBU1639865.1 flagellar basal-body rod protein FlgF [Pseudomonadota bacterium]
MHIQNRLGLIESTETMLAQTKRLNQITNNLANVDTAGYKKEDITFWEMLYSTDHQDARVGKAIHDVTDMQPGVIKETGNPLDFAIGGEGFFKVQTPAGVRYTRAGQFMTNNEGQLTTPSGDLVLGDGGPVLVTGNNISVADDGNIIVDGQPAGVLAVVTFANLADLEKQGQNLFALTGQSQEEQAQNFSVKQGYLEKSNVSTMKELTAMVDLNRAYETQQRLVRTIDDMDDKAISRVGRLNS